MLVAPMGKRGRHVKVWERERSKLELPEIKIGSAGPIGLVDGGWEGLVRVFKDVAFLAGKRDLQHLRKRNVPDGN